MRLDPGVWSLLYVGWGTRRLGSCATEIERRELEPYDRQRRQDEVGDDHQGADDLHGVRPVPFLYGD